MSDARAKEPVVTSEGTVGARAISARAPSVSWVGLFGREGLIKAALLAAGFLWLYWDHCIRLVRIWRDDPDWSHGFLIPLFSAYFIYSKRNELARTPVRPSWVGLGVLVAAVGGYFSAIYLKIGYPQPLSMVVALVGIVLLCCGWRVLWVTMFALGFLVLALPPPTRIYREITQPLQQFAALVSEQFLRLFPGVFIDRSGINLAYETDAGRSGAFTVAGACSGMRSLMAFIALGLAMAYFSPRPVWQRVVIAVVVVPVAVFCNIIRVVVTGSFQIYDLGNLAAGTPHALLGIGTFALGFAIYFAVLFVFDHLYVSVADEAAGKGAA